MEHIDAKCPSCSPLKPVPHIVLKSNKELLLQCGNCRHVHKERKPGKTLVRVIVSKGEESLHTRAMLSGVIRKGEEFVIDDEATGEAIPVQVTSIEVEDKRKYSAPAEDIKTLWAREINEVVVKIAVSYKETTESIELRVPGDREFIVGDKVKVNKRELKIAKIKIREGGFKRREGAAAKAKDIRRIYAASGIIEKKRIKRAGERVVIKKRESVWSLKRKETG